MRLSLPSKSILWKFEASKSHSLWTIISWTESKNQASQNTLRYVISHVMWYPEDGDGKTAVQASLLQYQDLADKAYLAKFQGKEYAISGLFYDAVSISQVI